MTTELYLAIAALVWLVCVAVLVYKSKNYVDQQGFVVAATIWAAFAALMWPGLLMIAAGVAVASAYVSLLNCIFNRG